MVILAAGAPSGAFSLISLPSLDQSSTYQMKAEYLTHRMVSFISLVLIYYLHIFEL